MEQPVIVELWDSIKTYLHSIFNLKTFFPDLLVSIIVILLALVIVFLGKRLTARLFSSSEDRDGEQVEAKMSQTLGILVDTVLTYSVYIIAALMVLYIFRIQLFSVEDAKTLAVMLIQSLIIIVLARAILQISQTMVNYWFFQEDKQDVIGKKRADTLGALLLSIFRYLILFIAAILVLQTFGVQTGAIIASAGILGLAVGFGAQNLVKDIISGFFILFEDQFSVGEYVTVAGVTGIVQELGLRSTTIREWTGHVYTIPNGEIVGVKNFDRHPILALIEVRLAYEVDIDFAIEVIEDTLENLYKEKDYILECPTILGVVAVNELGVDLQVIAKCTPGLQWSVEREMRKRIKGDLQAAGCPDPFPAIFVRQSGEEAKREFSDSQQEADSW